MAKIKDVMVYLLQNYPENMRGELSNARLTKMVYLSDWRHVLQTGKQITPINWYFDNYGPFVRDVEDTARSNPSLFVISDTQNYYGQRKKVFSLRGTEPTSLSPTEISAIDHIINITKKLYWSDFIRLVYSTHPIASSERYTYLDLISKGSEYKSAAIQVS